MLTRISAWYLTHTVFDASSIMNHRADWPLVAKKFRGLVSKLLEGLMACRQA